jgi:hypothetical protein
MPLTIDFPASTATEDSQISPFRNNGKRQLITYEDIASFEVSEGDVVIGYYDRRTGSWDRFYHRFSTNLRRDFLADTFRIIRSRAEKRADDGRPFTAPWELYIE